MMKNLLQGDKIGDILVKQNAITEDQLKEALHQQKFDKKPIGEVLVSMGLALEEDVYRALAEQLNIPFADNDSLLGAKEKVVKIVPDGVRKQHPACGDGRSG